MTPSGLGLESARKEMGFELIPAGTTCQLRLNIKPGNTGLEGLLTRSSTGAAEMLVVEYVVVGGPHDKVKVFDNLVLAGSTSGHAKAGEISRTKLRAMFEAVHAIDPNDNSPATITRRANATLAEFNGATFLGVIDVENGGKKSDGTFYKDRNVLAKILRPGDQGYVKLDQPPPQPIARSGPPPQTSAPAANGSPAVAAITKPDWAQ